MEKLHIWYRNGRWYCGLRGAPFSWSAFSPAAAWKMRDRWLNCYVRASSRGNYE